MTRQLLVVRSASRLCGLDVAHVDEVMRPMRVEPVPNVPSFVRGVSIIRGKATPIVDLCALLGGDAETDAKHLVTLRTTSSERVGLLVAQVLGLQRSEALALDPLPALLQSDDAIVEQLARHDGDLLTVLRTSKLVPDGVLARWAEATA
jgi:purine-binding chemotaxis protein CheW